MVAPVRESPLPRELLLEHKEKFVAIALLFVALSVQALTLGRIRGAALIGQSLDMAIPVQLDAGEDGASLCLGADVFHADARQDPARVRVTVEPTAQALTVSARVTSSALIDEPVVTIYLRTGCGQKTTRRYVVLADPPSEVEPAALPFIVPANIAPAARATVERPDAAVVPVAPTVGAPGTAAKRRTPKAQTSSVEAPKPTAAPSAAERPARATAKAGAKEPGSTSAASTRKSSAGRPRLKLDPLELLSDRVANLDSFMTFEPSEDALREREKVHKLEADVKALREAAARNQASVLDLRARLQKAEEQRLPVGLIYGLLGVGLLGLLGAGWYLYRRRQNRARRDQWWSGSSSMSVPPPEAGSGHGAPVSTQLMKRDGSIPARRTGGSAGASASAEAGSVSEVDVTLIDMSDSHFDDFLPADARPRKRRQPASVDKPNAPAPTNKVVRVLHSPAVLEVRRQSEALAARGKTDLAVRTLKKQIGESEEPNPFVYLDLFALIHSLGLKTEFAQLRQDFKLLFNGRVPDFAFFRDEGKGLEAYPEVLSRLTGLWGKPKVLDAIETLIFRDPWVEDAQIFDFAAFRDLLLLHGVASGAVVGTAAQAAAVAGAGLNTVPMGRPDGVEARDTMPAPSDLSQPTAAQGSGLDLDLSAFELAPASQPQETSPQDIDLPLLMPFDLGTDAVGPATAGPRPSAKPNEK